MSSVPMFAAPMAERQARLAEVLRERARSLERQARADRRLAHKVLSPPEGVSVEVHWTLRTVTFVGPVIEHGANSQPEPQP